MKTNTTAPNYKGFRFPPEIIGHAVWLYFRFSLSFRDVEELLAERGIVVLPLDMVDNSISPCKRISGWFFRH